MAKLDEVLDLANETRRADVDGQIDPAKLTPKGKLLLDVGYGRVDPTGFTAEQRALVGLDPTMMQSVTGAVAPALGQVASAAGKLTAVTPPRQTRSWSETAFGPMTEAMSAPPPITSSLMGMIPGGQEPGPINLAGKLLGGIERGIQTFGGGIAGASGVVEKAFEDQSLVGGDPKSTLASRGAGALADAASWLIGLPKAPKLSSMEAGVGRRIIMDPPPPMKAIGPGSNEGRIMAPSEVTRSMLPEGKKTLALPAGGRQARELEAGSNLGVQVPKESQYPGVPSEPMGPPPPPPKALPPGKVQKAIEPGSNAGEIVPKEQQYPGTQGPIGPPPPPPQALERYVPPPEVPRAGAPADLPPVPQVDLPVGAPVGVKPELPKAPKTPRPTAFQERTQHVDAASVDIHNPEEVWSYLKGEGGIASSDIEGLPLGVKNRKGLAFDEYVDVVSKAQGRSPQEVEAAMSRSLTRYRDLKKQQAGKPTLQELQSREPLPGEAAAYEAGADVPPPELSHMFDPGEWEGMSYQQRKGTVEQIRQEMAGTEIPKPPFVEKTAIGDQAVIPGAEGRSIPTGKTQAPGAQKPPDTTPLFGQEKAAQQAASDAAQGQLPEAPQASNVPPGGETKPPPGKGPKLTSFVPPVPLPGPEEGQEDTPEGKAQRLAQAAGIAVPLALTILGRMRGRGTPPPPAGTPRAGGAPPEVPAAFRREEVGPPRAAVPEPVAAAQPTVPPQVIRAKQAEVIQQVKARGPEMAAPDLGDQLSGGAGGFSGPPRSGMNLPADTPSSPFPEAGRSARFFEGSKVLLSSINTPEDVVRGNPAGNALVRLTYRRYDDGKMLVRELDDALSKVTAGISDVDLEKIKKVMDTNMAAAPQALPPNLADAAVKIRQHLDALADATGLPRSDRIENYFPRLRDTVKVETTKLVLDPTGVPYMSRTFVDDIRNPQRWEPFYLKARTATDEAGMPARDALRIYNRATARHLTMNGGVHPFTGEMLPGYLNELQPMLAQQSEAFKPYLGEFINYFLGVPGSRPGTEVGHQISRIFRNTEAARLIGGNIGSSINNTMQMFNTAAHVSPTSLARGFADMLIPERRALAQRFIGLEELAKADLDVVQKSAERLTALDRIENASARTAEMSMSLFRRSELTNRYHAFLAGLRDAEGYGLQGRPAIEYARDIVEQTQFPGSGPSKIAATRGPVGATVGQFKQYPIRQTQFVKNMVEQDLKELAAAYTGKKEVPLEIMGKQYIKPDGTPAMRPLNTMVGSAQVPLSRFIPMGRTAKWVIGTTAVGGPDVWFPGFDDYLREKEIAVPSISHAIAVGIGSMSNMGVIDAGDVTRSLLFFLPGPLVGHTQDIMSAASGYDWGTGMTNMLHGGVGQELTTDQRIDRAIRSLPVAGIGLARARRSAKIYQGGGDERAARTALEALGLEPASGPLIARGEPPDAAKVMLGLPSPDRERQFRHSQDLGNLEEQTNKALEKAADQEVTGDMGGAHDTLREAEDRLGLEPGSLELSKQGLEAAELRHEYTPLERKQHQLRNRFPTAVEESRQRTGGERPPEPPRSPRPR